MRILLVAATAQEWASVAYAETVRAGVTGHGSITLAGHAVDVLVTGVGMVATAAWCSRALAAAARYDLAINVGVCGAFDRSLSLGGVVHVVSDRLAEMGAEDGESFIPLDDLGLSETGGAPYTRPELINTAPPASAELKALPAVSGITVNTVHGRERTIAEVLERFAPQVESMEGAAFMYACMVAGLPFAQIRGVSNFVERRNRRAWRLSDAIGNVGAAARRIIEAL